MLESLTTWLIVVNDSNMKATPLIHRRIVLAADAFRSRSSSSFRPHEVGKKHNTTYVLGRYTISRKRS